MTRICGPSEDDVVVTIEDIERLGTSNFDATGRAYYNSGIGLEQTLGENVAAFSRLRLRPRVLRNVAERRIEVTLLGDQKLSMPIGISPTAFQKMAHPDGEIAVAKAAQAAATLMMLSSFSNDSLEDVQRGAPGGLRWFQLHIFRDREFTRNLVERAERSGYRALVLTVDMTVEGARNFDKMSDFCVPEHLSETESSRLPFLVFTIYTDLRLNDDVGRYFTLLSFGRRHEPLFLEEPVTGSVKTELWASYFRK